MAKDAVSQEVCHPQGCPAVCHGGRAIVWQTDPLDSQVPTRQGPALR